MVRMALNLETGYTQFPNIYFGNEHIGGRDDLVGYLHSQNVFEKLMNENGIQPSSATDITEGEECLLEKLRTPTSAMDRFEETPESFHELMNQNKEKDQELFSF